MNKSELSRDERVFGIVIPFYREIDYLLELVESLKNQTDPRFEVLIIDDSSRMLISPEWITQKLDNRFSVKTNEINLGPFQTWNLGLSEMMNRQKYSLVSIVHEDDVLHPNYVKNSLACLVKHPEIDIFHSKVKVIGPRGKRKFSFQDMFKRIGYRGLSYKPVLAVSDQGLARILNNNYLFCPTMVFNSVKFTKIEFDFWCRWW
jgi:glycosyltransferase involved in cell wall biosynthesis